MITSWAVAAVRSFTLAALAFVIAMGGAQAQVTPFKITGDGVAPQGIPIIPGTPKPHSAVGHASQLGTYSGEGSLQILNFTGPTTADFDSAAPFVFVAANGDTLAFTYGDTQNGAHQPGQVTIFPAGGQSFVAVFVAEFNPVPALSTGRFANIVAGSVVMVWTTDPFSINASDPVAYSWDGQGWLQFQRGTQ